MRLDLVLLALPCCLLLGTALRAADLPLEKRVYKDANGKTLPYRLLTPAHAEPGHTYPLVIFLHGAGERGGDNEKQLVHGVPNFAADENRKKYPCYLIAPQCPEQQKWSDVDWGADRTALPPRPSESARLTLELIDALRKEFPIDPRRIYLTGLSMGGYGTWDLLARHPEVFAAGVPVCGGGDEATAPTIATIPIWAFHGGKDTVVKPERSRRMIEAIKKAGGTPKYTEYPTVGHDSWVRAYRDPALMEWLFAQRRP